MILRSHTAATARIISSAINGNRDSEGDTDDEDAQPRLSSKARGKLPEHSGLLRHTGSSSLSPLSPLTPAASQSSSSRKRHRASQPAAPRKRGRSDANDDHSNGEPEVIEISDSEDDVPATTSRQATSAPVRSTDVRAGTSQRSAHAQVAEITPPSDLAAAFAIMSNARRTVSRPHNRCS